MNSPWVLLGIRSTPKADLGVSAAELVYGAPLTLPGEFVAPGDVSDSCFRPLDILPHLRAAARSFRPVSPVAHGTRRSQVPPDLQSTEFVFVRRDAHRAPLSPRYEGPFRLLRRENKFFIIDRGGRPDAVSIDRLKPAHVDPDVSVILAQPPRRGQPPKVRTSPTI